MSRKKSSAEKLPQIALPSRPRSMSLSADWESVMGGSTRQNLSRVILPPSGTGRVALTLERKEQITFCTQSKYEGQWSNINMDGFGNYTLPHDVEYEGFLKDGVWDGQGTLIYPTNAKIEGEWKDGKMFRRLYRAPDGLEMPEDYWDYCEMPDRRFYSEIMQGLRPAGRSQLTDDTPTRPIPEGCYDTGDGFFNPKTKCVVSPSTGDIVRIPTKKEEEWIISHCRKAWDENVGFRPDLYECWYAEDDDSSDEPVKEVFVVEDDENEETYSHVYDSGMFERASIYSGRQESWSRARAQSEEKKSSMVKERRVSVDRDWPSGMQPVLNIKKFYRKDSQQNGKQQEDHPAQKFHMDLRSQVHSHSNATRRHKSSRREEKSKTEWTHSFVQEDRKQADIGQEAAQDRRASRISRASLLLTVLPNKVKLGQSNREMISAVSRTSRGSKVSERGKSILEKQREKPLRSKESIMIKSQRSGEIQRTNSQRESYSDGVHFGRESPKGTGAPKERDSMSKRMSNKENELVTTQTEIEENQGRKQDQAADEHQRNGHKAEFEEVQPAPDQSPEN